MELNMSTVMGGDIVVIDLVGSLVASSAEQLKSQITKLMEKRFHYILLEMSNVDFIDSSGLGACMAAHKQLSESNGMVIFVKPSDRVAKVFRITKADQKFNVLATKHDGVKYLYEKMLEAKQK